MIRRFLVLTMLAMAIPALHYCQPDRRCPGVPDPDQDPDAADSDQADADPSDADADPSDADADPSDADADPSDADADPSDADADHDLSIPCDEDSDCPPLTVCGGGICR